MQLRRTTGIWLGLGLAAACGSSKSGGNNDVTVLTGDDGGSSGGESGDEGGTPGASGSSGGATSSGSSGGASHAEGGTGGSSGADAQAEAATGSGGLEAGTLLDGDGGTCATLTGLTANQTEAEQIVDQTRAAMGSPCATMVATLNTSSTKHCTYYATNYASGGASSACIADAHVEVSTCTDYVAAQFYDRETAAGYTGSPDAEDMAFEDNGTQALDEWINSVWHRTPILDPWTRDYGYGSATMCDTMDFGVGASAPSDLIVTYPYNGQTGVPTSFNGAEEGPTPPVPPNGWPSGYPVHVYIAGLNAEPTVTTTVTTHEFSVVGGAQLAHQWITPSTPNAVLFDSVVLYGNDPLTANTTYLVHVAGTRSGATFDVNITFTTQ